MKIRLTLIGKRDWEKINDLTGEEVRCTFYQALDEKNKPMEFKSQWADYEIHETLKFEQGISEEFDLKAQYDSFKGRMKFIDISSKGAITK